MSKVANAFCRPSVLFETPALTAGKGSHSTTPFSQESYIPSFCHHLSTYKFVSQSHILAQMFLTKLTFQVAAAPVFC